MQKKGITPLFDTMKYNNQTHKRGGKQHLNSHTDLHLSRSSGVRNDAGLNFIYLLHTSTLAKTATFRTDLSITSIGTKTPQRKHMEETILATPLKILLLGINIPIR